MAKNKPRGRPSSYTPEIAKSICERLSAGESLRSICRDDEMPSEVSVRRWVVEDREGFSAHYARARDAGLECMAEELLEIADDGSNDWMEKHSEDGASLGWALNGEHVQRSRVRIDTRKWLLSKMAPKRYGDKLTVAGDENSPVRHVVEHKPAIDFEEVMKRASKFIADK